jgi:hypothetical protein
MHFVIEGRISMRRLATVSLILMAFVLVTPSWAVPACVSGGTLASYEALASGCQIGDKIFSSFTDINSGTNPLTAAEITVTPINGAEIGVQFNAPWSASAGQSSDSDITFVVSVVSGGPLLIDDASVVQSSSGFIGDGVANVSEGVCGPTPCTPTLTLQTVNSAGTTSLKDHKVFTPTGSVFASKDIAVNGNTGFASLSSVQDTFSQTGVPEPTAMGLLGSALVGLSFIARKRGWARR